MLFCWVVAPRYPASGAGSRASSEREARIPPKGIYGRSHLRPTVDRQTTYSRFFRRPTVDRFLPLHRPLPERGDFSSSDGAEPSPGEELRGQVRGFLRIFGKRSYPCVIDAHFTYNY
ncbi:hypothetical protein HMPREF1556_00948 [Porphyromonas sp. oral taxon 278 str. W7784]|nr:hypothetical protein HMPREF1556_00948 [Porphyromonas sp. oral taxon 278 str. W7784]